MSQPLTISVPHRLGRREAKLRLDSGMSRIQSELAAFVGGFDYSWEDDRLNFRASAMWQTITGRLDVLDDAVRIEIDLPWMMRLLRETITRRIRGWGIALLEKPPGEGQLFGRETGLLVSDQSLDHPPHLHSRSI